MFEGVRCKLHSETSRVYVQKGNSGASWGEEKTLDRIVFITAKPRERQDTSFQSFKCLNEVCNRGKSTGCGRRGINCAETIITFLALSLSLSLSLLTTSLFSFLVDCERLKLQKIRVDLLD